MNDKILTAEFILRLRSFVRRRVRSEEEAEDITQNTLLKFVRDRDSISEDRGPAWIFTVARNEIVNHFRRNEAASSEEDKRLVDSEKDSDSSAIQELAHCVEPLLRRLSESDREILHRVDLLGESQVDIAAALGVARSTIKSRTQRARKRFHRELLSCCKIELDVRGTPVAFASNSGSQCGCSLETCTNSIKDPMNPE